VRRVGLAALVATASACGAGEAARLPRLSTNWVDDSGASIDRVWQRVATSPVPPVADVVVGVAGQNEELLGLPLDGSPKWTLSHALDARPVVAGGVVVGSGAGEVFAADAKTGKVFWRTPTPGMALLGAGDDGAATVVSLRTMDGTRHRLLGVGRDGIPLLTIDTEVPLGTPAVVAHLAFVPWAGQYISVIDLATGDEIGRATLREETTRAWTSGGALWFGQKSFIRFDAHIREASRGGASMVTAETDDLPGEPRVGMPGTAHVFAAANAADEVRAYARPDAAQAGAALVDGRVYSTYFRLAFGALPGKKGEVAWVHVHPASFLGGGVEEGDIVLCDEAGNVTELDGRTGGVVSELSLGKPLKACVVSVDAHRAAAPPAAMKPLAAQISDAVLTDDPQLAVAQKALIVQLGAVPDEQATATLVDLASDPRTSPVLLPVAREQLAKRRTGASFLEAALAKHYDFLAGVLRPPPVGPIAKAVATMGDGAAAPLLAEQLLDPANTAGDVREAATALAVVARPEQLPTLRRFFGMYRASATDDDTCAAVVGVAKAILAVGGKEGREMLEAAAHDANTAPGVREPLVDLLTNTQNAGDAGAPGG
jgi:outer membrane protein assembly factor BamB